MEQPISNSTPKPYDFNIEHFKIRLTARLGIILTVIVISISRIATICGENIPASTRLSFALSMPFTVSMGLVVTVEYLLFKKLGPGIVKYTTLVDILLLLCLMGDWITVVVATANKINHTDPITLQVGSVFGFTAFSWRTLMVTLIVQKWQLKIIPPCVAVMLAAGYVIHWTSGPVFYNLLSAAAQLANIIIIIYCEDKVKFKMIQANIQQDRWRQVNNFILNSLPENIMVLDLSGEVKFISEYFQSFIKKAHLPDDPKEFFKKVQDLTQQYDIGPPSTSTSMLQTERLTTANGLLDTEENLGGLHRNLILEDLLISVKNIIKKDEMQEKQFLVYNGKLRVEGHKDKSLEVKISFVKHSGNYYIVLILRDTTQRDLIVTLEETNKYKDQLLASVSHELRAPLNGNINLVESAVNSQKIPDSVKESLLIPALRSSKFLLHIINDILDMSQIKEKKLRLVFQSENLRETVRSTAQLVELQAKKKGISLQVELDPHLPKMFCTDHIRVSQIILNLINNAIKFTREGVVKLRVEATPEPNLIKISVEDSGIGMSHENVQKLFSSYTHIEFEERQSMNPTGVGLGLNIAYNLSILLGPKGNKGITVTSMPGEGSTFSLLLESKQKEPMKLSDSQTGDSIEVADESPRLAQSLFFAQLQRNDSESAKTLVERGDSYGSNSSCSCPKILIVDDNPFNTMAFETILDSMNVKCDSVYSGSACIKILLSRQSKVCGENCKQYSVIFMDQEMPEMNGTETVYEIKRLEEEGLLVQGMKIVGCTAHKSKEEVDKFMVAGLDQCIHKPISGIMIRDILKRSNNSQGIEIRS